MTPKELRLLRSRVGWTRRKMADYLGMSVHAVKGYEQAEDSKLHRKPNGAVIKLYQELQRKLFAGEIGCTE